MIMVPEMVIYHLDNGECTLAELVEYRPERDGRRADAELRIDMRTGVAAGYIGRDGWFSADFVAANGGVVPENADEGIEPGQFESVTTFAERLATELQSLRLVHAEARELIGEADSTGTIPQANIEALRALLWRATIKAKRPA